MQREPSMDFLWGWKRIDTSCGPVLARGTGAEPVPRTLTVGALVLHLLIPALLIVAAYQAGTVLVAPVIFILGVLLLWGSAYRSGWRLGRGFAEAEQWLGGRLLWRRRISHGEFRVVPD